MFANDRELLAADRPLAAYFASVAEAGSDAWRQERAHIAGRNRHLPPERRGDPLSIGSLTAMLPTWRAWGQLIMEAAAPQEQDGNRGGLS